MSFKISCFDKICLRWTLCLTATLSLPSAAETVTVDLAISEGAPTYIGSGFLHGMTPTTPPDSMVNPLKPKLFRCAEWSQCFQIYPRAKALGARLQLVLSDSSGYKAPWPGDGGDWAPWLATVDRIVKKAKTEGKSYEWDIWNEGDTNTFFWIRSIAQFNEMWRRTHVKIREIDPNAVIVGPSPASYGPWLKNFLLYAKTNNVLPTVLSWHEFEGATKMALHIADIRQFMAANGINSQRISINEYVGANEISSPGSNVWSLAAIGRSKVESSAHSCWGVDENNADNCGNYSLDALVRGGDKLPLAPWWVYKGYADITGTLVRVSPGATTDGVAGRDSGSKAARIVLGRNDTSATAATMPIETIIKNISASAPYLLNGGKVHVVAQMIPNKWKNTLPAPLPMINADYTVSNDQVSVSLPNFNPVEAYLVTLTAPGSTTSPQLALSGSTVSANATAGASAPAPQSIGVTNASGGTLQDVVTTISYASGNGWLSVQRLGSGNSQTLTNSFGSTGLAPGTYSATVTVSSPNASNQERYTVTLQLAPPPTLTLSVKSLFAGAVSGQGNPSSQLVQITNGGSGTLQTVRASISYGSGNGWLAIQVGGGGNSQTLTNSFDVTTLSAGNYAATVTVTSPNASQAATYSVSLKITAVEEPALSLSAAGVTASALAGAGNPSPKTLHVTNSGTGTLTAVSTQIAYGLTSGWLSVRVTGDGNSQSLTHSFDVSGLALGSHTATVTVASFNAARSVSYPVTLLLESSDEPRVYRVALSGPDQLAPKESATFTTELFDQHGAPSSAPVAWSVSGGGALSGTTEEASTQHRATFTSDGDEGAFLITATSGSVEGSMELVVRGVASSPDSQSSAGVRGYVGCSAGAGTPLAGFLGAIAVCFVFRRPAKMRQKVTRS